MLKLRELEELSRLIYKKREAKLYEWLRRHNIKTYNISSIQDNDRAIIFFFDETIYIAIAGTDDKVDWRENMQVCTDKRLMYGYAGYAQPAEGVLNMLRKFCRENGTPFNRVMRKIIGHSRGGAIAANLYAQIKKEYGVKNLEAITFGAPPPGGGRFKKRCGNCGTLVAFQIKGDPVWRCIINPFGRHIGRQVKLPKQIKGFRTRLKELFKGNMNHRCYHCVNEIEPWKNT